MDFNTFSYALTLVLPLLVCFAGIVGVFFIHRMFNDD